MAGSLTSTSTPWCTVFLVVSTVLFNAVVLIGNKWTADALREIGQSTRGWSNVGTGIASALQTEIDQKMNNVSSLLLGSLEHVLDAQGQLDVVLSMVGNETDAAIAKHPELSLLQQHGPERGLVLLQEVHGKNSSHVEALVPVVISAIHQVMDFVMEEVEKGLHTLLEKIKPALEQVGKWILQFGDKVTKGLEDFSSTLDKAQKMFDQVMAQLNGGGNNSDLMIEQTWPIFDDDDSGEVSSTELKNVGNWFAISALQGNKAEALIKKYDASGDGEIGPREFEKLVNDPSIPGSLSVILRKYAKRLAEIAGDVGEARLRDDVAHSVANYVKLVCAKNMTKVDWIADRLGNGSLPLDFTGTVFVEMCLSSKDPNAAVFTSADTGLLLTTEVYKLHSEAMLSTIDLLGNSSWWQSQGYDLKDQPACIKMATAWITQVQKSVLTQKGTESLSLLQGDSTLQQELELLEAMPEAAFIMAEESARLYRLERLQARQRRRSQLFSSATSQLLLKRLLGGVSASDVANQDAASAALQGGVPAVPETLEFAEFLRINASERAKELQHYSFDYASESSNSIDDFASKIQAMIKKVESFIGMMEKYSTPKGINDLEAKVEEFLTTAIEDVRKTVESRLVGLINKSAPQLESALHSAAHNAGQRLGEMIGSVISSPLAQSLEKPLEDILAEAVGSNTTAAKIGESLSNALGGEISNLTASALGDKLGDALEGLLDKALDKASDLASEGLDTLTGKLNPKVSLLSMDSEIDRLFNQRKHRVLEQDSLHDAGVSDTISHTWQGMVNLLRTFSNLLPTAVSTLKDARSEVSKLSSNLDSIFTVFEAKGPQIFNTVANLWVTIWVFYFLFILPFCAFTLYYGLWANGWFGGPKPILQEEAQGEQTFWQRLSLLCSKCCTCCRNFHDTDLCFWSIIIFMQVIVLVTFLISVVMAIFAGVKAMIVAGCGQVYVLEDPDVCESALTTLRTFLTKMSVGNSTIYTDEDIHGICDENLLLTCEMVTATLTKSTIATTVFSFLASIFSLQMLFDAATLHEQAVWRRKAAAAKAGRLVRQARNLKELFSDLSGRQGGLRAEVPCLTLCLTLSPTLAQHPIAKPCLEASVSLSVSHGTLISFSVARWDPCSVFFFRRFRHLEFARSFGGSRFLEQRRRPPNRGHSWPSACCARWSVQLCDRTGAASKTCALSCQLQFSAPWARSKTKGWIWVRRPTVLNTCPDEMMDAVLRFYHSPKPKQLMPLTNMLQKHLWLWCSAAFAC
ncbi:unnamed protein product [Symbiodinium pilosum]|uniref:EF-hand domain-containing protein n=1 Tax=Symbiodinium pilosum TaxID=2952 RepID=A0A812LZQ6_SYMPI|nr:unnamed protein product [Symbiodinium pilosum]